MSDKRVNSAEGTKVKSKKDKPNEKFFCRVNTVKLLSSILVLVVLFGIGLVFFARPTVSELEKRELTKFPELTWDSLMSGEFTSNLSTWYADTFPIRERMVNTNFFLQSLYGIRGESINAGGTGDDIPDEPMDLNKPTDNGNGNFDTATGLYVNGDTAYELYHFSQANSTRYVQLVNLAAQKLGSSATVYDIIVPLNYTFALQDSGKKYGASDCRESIRYMYSGLQNVKAVDICPVLSEHNEEYTYFRTDHHWTALGAYYSYTAFCQVKNITPTPLESYQKLVFDGFLGTLYAEAKQPQAMKNNPDKVEAFVPMGTNSITVLDKSTGQLTEYSIVNKATQAWYPAANAKYNCFIAGDNPYSEIHNPSKNDGSSVVVVKESFGNAFVPFLVDSYEYVYVVDYRYYNGNLIDLVNSKKIDDVIFINNVIATSTSSRLNELEDIIK